MENGRVVRWMEPLRHLRRQRERRREKIRMEFALDRKLREILEDW